MQAVNSTGWFAELLAPHAAPCVSMYFPTQRAAPPADQNLVRYRDLVDKARDLMAGKYDAKVYRPVLEQLENLPRELFGAGPRDAIAVFAAPDFVRVLNLQRPMDDLLVVADSFHIKPLIRTMQFGDRFSVLCFSLQNVRVAEGNRYELNDVQVPDLPHSIQEASLEQNLQANAAGRPHADKPLHGHETGAVPRMRPEQFMRLVDQRVWENYSRQRHLPLVVVADAQHIADFLAMTKNDYALEQGVALNPDGLSGERLREEAWKVIEPRYHEEIKRLGDQFRVARAHHNGSDELMEVAQAAANGRVGTLIVDAEHHIPGILHRTTGFVEQSTRSDGRGGDDVLDDLAEMVLKMDGQVYVLPHDQMPTEAGVAAVYRF